MSGTKWTAKERATLREVYGTKTVQRVAKILGRSVKAVYQQAVFQGLGSVGRKGWWRAELGPFVAEHVATGQLDQNVAAEWNVAHPEEPIGRRMVGYVRHRLGVASESQTAARRAGNRRGYRLQCENLHVGSLVDLSRRAARRKAIRAGWPPSCTPAEIAILESLLANGPQTRPQLAASLGRLDKPPDHWFASRRSGGSLLSDLGNLGLVRRSERRVATGGGKGRSLYVYGLTQKARNWHARGTRRSLCHGRSTLALAVQ
jgi:hypothetical protein